MSQSSFYYQGGRPAPNSPAELPPFRPWSDEHPMHYVPEDGLRDAVNVALALGQPLLLTGEPGTGKTQLAHSIAYDLGLGETLVFDTKTTTTAQDLFYRYDALRHFRDAQSGKPDLRVRDYVDFQALGLAILRAMDPAVAAEYLPEELRGQEPRRSVVLVDEIDKAPRDVPNDLLQEIEAMRFRVREGGPGDFPLRLEADPGYRPVVVLTSNSEKNLPDAFLRRCVFYHLSFPGDEQLLRIVRNRLGPGEGGQGTDHAAVQELGEIRKLPLNKKPATAELLAWVKVLRAGGIDPRANQERVGPTYAVLAKTVDDLNRMRGRIGLDPV